VIEHLQRLGANCLELLPVHAKLAEPGLALRGATNYWGYSTLGFFAPEPSYARAADPLAVVAEFRDMVTTLHSAGIEVILDVVYNHTCEGGVDGPFLSWRGLDEMTYYRADGGQYVDTTGCGNSLDTRKSRVVQLVLDSLRHWITDMGVDGFRFDLAPTVARGPNGFDPDHPFLVAARADPVIGASKLIAEPWDIGPHGWRTGQFPAPFSEWNDRFRDSVREFWLADTARVRLREIPSGVRDLATCLAGSADMFAPMRGPLASVNFITAHDGFTLADCVAYNVKHNEANGENNADGSDYNRTWNHGIEGDTSDPVVLGLRRHTLRNLLGTLFCAAGVPMLLAGDEFGRSQGGNNNPYCLDDETTWLDWNLEPWQEELLSTTAHLIHLRHSYPALRQSRFFAGRPTHGDETKDLAWFAADGAEMNHDRWYDPWGRTLQMYLRGTGTGPEDRSILIIVQARVDAIAVTLPGAPWGEVYRLVWDSAEARPRAEEDQIQVHGGTTQSVDGHSLRIYVTEVPAVPV
jgi:glycogen operon protein